MEEYSIRDFWFKFIYFSCYSEIVILVHRSHSKWGPLGCSYLNLPEDQRSRIIVNPEVKSLCGHCRKRINKELKKTSSRKYLRYFRLKSNIIYWTNKSIATRNIYSLLTSQTLISSLTSVQLHISLHFIFFTGNSFYCKLKLLEETFSQRHSVKSCYKYYLQNLQQKHLRKNPCLIIF